jgi:hypothetical protein
MSGRTEATRRSAQVLLAILVALPMTAGAQAFNQLCTINSLNFAAAANPFFTSVCCAKFGIC